MKRILIKRIDELTFGKIYACMMVPISIIYVIIAIAEFLGQLMAGSVGFGKIIISLIIIIAFPLIGFIVGVVIAFILNLIFVHIVALEIDISEIEYSNKK